MRASNLFFKEMRFSWALILIREGSTFYLGRIKAGVKKWPSLLKQGMMGSKR